MQPVLIALNLVQIPASLLMVVLAERLVRRPGAYGLGSAAYVVGVLGVIFAPGHVAVVAATVAGFANAALLTLALALPSMLGDGEEVPQLSAAMLSIDYGFGVLTAVLAGHLWESSGTVVFAVLPFALTAALPEVVGLTLRPPATTPPR